MVTCSQNHPTKLNEIMHKSADAYNFIEFSQQSTVKSKYGISTTSQMTLQKRSANNTSKADRPIFTGSTIPRIISAIKIFFNYTHANRTGAHKWVPMASSAHNLPINLPIDLHDEAKSHTHTPCSCY